MKARATTAPATPNLPEIEARIAELLAALAEPPQVRSRAEELVRTLMDLYGEGLARIVDGLGCEDVARLAEDDLLASLFILHDLHPRTVQERVGLALERLRPLLAASAGGAELVGIDEHGVARIRLTGTGKGCGCSSSAALRDAVENAVLDAAPELARVEVADPPASGPVLLQIGPRPEQGSRS